MTEHVITAPTSSTRLGRRRYSIVVALVALLAAGAGAAVGALVASDQSVIYRSAPAQPTAAGPVDSITSAGGRYGNALLAVVTATPSETTQLVSSLSPAARRVIGNAAQANAAARVSSIWPAPYPPAMPDNATLMGLLTNLDPADRSVILRVLAPEAQADFQALMNGAAIFRAP